MIMDFDKHGALEMAKIGYGAKRPKAADPVKVQDPVSYTHLRAHET